MFTWFELAWPWIGLGFAAVLVFILFATGILRGDLRLPRWRDPRWLGWLSIAIYLLHQVEEYGIAADGVPHAFPDALCTTLGQPPYPSCAIPPLFFLAVNLPLVWLAAPVAVLLSRRTPLIGLTLWGVIAINALLHIGGAIITQAYDPGLLTALILFVPLSVWTAVAVFRRRTHGFGIVSMLVVLGAGLLMHAALGGSVALFLRGAIPAWLLIAIQPVSIAIGYGLVTVRARSTL